MKLPNADRAEVPRAKIVDYLLSLSHRDGRGKAGFFLALGFSAETWTDLADALRRHAREHDVSREETSPYGTRYVVEGAVNTPDGRTAEIRVIWFLGHNEEEPRLVTAYPLPRRRT